MTAQNVGAQAAPENLPAGPHNLKVFHYGTAGRSLLGSAARQLPTIVPPCSATNQTFTLTPQQPYLEAIGALNSFYPFYFDGFSNNIAFEPDVVPTGKTSSLELMLCLQAGHAYNFDETVLVGGGNGCNFVVTGPDGTKTTIPCTGSNAAVQHLNFAYSGEQTGWVFFETSGFNQALWWFNSVVITQH